MMAAVLEAIEPDAAAMIHEGASDELIAAASLAISLKRIADFLGANDGLVDVIAQGVMGT